MRNIEEQVEKKEHEEVPDEKCRGTRSKRKLEKVPMRSVME